MSENTIQQSKRSTCDLIKNFLRLAIPAMISCSFFMLTPLFNTIFVGQMNDASKLAGVGLGTMMLNMGCLWIMIGINGAQETLASQAFGANDLKMCGRVLNRGRIILTIAFIPMAVLNLFAEPILLAAGQDPEVSKYA